MGRAILRGSAVVVTLLLLSLAAGLLYRAWRQHETAQTLAIKSPPGIDEASFVKIGGIDQFVQIRGDDRANPVILFVHGGPGISMMGLTTVFRPWEKYFTVVQWDQRGDGKTYGRNGGAAEASSMTIGRMTADGIEVAAYLRAHLHKKGIVLLGHSWGTVLGVRMIKARPDLFSAYVATGELVAKQDNELTSYNIVLDLARASHNAQAVKELEAIRPPPYKDLDTLLVQRKWMDVYDLPSERDLFRDMAPAVAFTPNYSLADIYDMHMATAFSQHVLFDELNNFDARPLGLDFQVPFFIFQGEEDLNTPTVLARNYFNTLHAPVKQFVTLKGAGHDAVMTVPDVFLKELVARVRPVALENQPSP